MALMDKYDIINKAILCNPSFNPQSMSWFQNEYSRLRIVSDQYRLVQRRTAAVTLNHSLTVRSNYPAHGSPRPCCRCQNSLSSQRRYTYVRNVVVLDLKIIFGHVYDVKETWYFRSKPKTISSHLSALQSSSWQPTLKQLNRPIVTGCNASPTDKTSSSTPSTTFVSVRVTTLYESFLSSNPIHPLHSSTVHQLLPKALKSHSKFGSPFLNITTRPITNHTSAERL